jgi:DNA-binding CsgD family transcriptional regulator
LSGFTVSEHDTLVLRDIVASATTVEDDRAPVPWPFLAGLGELFRSEHGYLAELDTISRRHVFMQRLEGQEVVHESLEEARVNSFWTKFWTPEGCGHPSLTGDIETVTKRSDFRSVRELRSLGKWSPECANYLMARIRLAQSGHHLRLLLYRSQGSDFSERERLMLTLLRPHIEHAYQTGVRARSPRQDLTPRQTELLALVRDGRTNRQVARALGISEATVRTHLNNIYERLDVASRTEAVTRVFLEG